MPGIYVLNRELIKIEVFNLQKLYYIKQIQRTLHPLFCIIKL
jgi:hypothetical protein